MKSPLTEVAGTSRAFAGGRGGDGNFRPVIAAHVQEIGEQDTGRDDEAQDPREPESRRAHGRRAPERVGGAQLGEPEEVASAEPYSPQRNGDRKSTRLNSSHSQISYAVFCLKKKKECGGESKEGGDSGGGGGV